LSLKRSYSYRENPRSLDTSLEKCEGLPIKEETEIEKANETIKTGIKLPQACVLEVTIGEISTRTMSTQHPDNVNVPAWSNGEVIDGNTRS